MTTQHERDRETGLDYRGARFYDSDIGRFLSLDPLAMEYPQWSDYNYVLGNPIIYVDPDGKAPDNVIISVNANDDTKDGFGHARIAVEEYKPMLQDNGTTLYQKTGRVAVFDLAPVTKPSALQAYQEQGVEPGYTVAYFNTEEFIETQKNEYDGVLEIQTVQENETGIYTQDEVQADLDVMGALTAAVDNNNPYVASSNNCSSLVCTGLSPIMNTSKLGKETVKLPGIFSQKILQMDTPNKVYNDLKGKSNVRVLKSAGNATKYTAQDYVNQRKSLFKW